MKRALKILRSLLLGLLLSALPAGILYGGAVYDFDGDGRTDMIVRRNNGYGNEFTWLISRSSAGVYAPMLGYPSFGSERFTDHANMGDYDGDGKWDVAIARHERARDRLTWHILNSNDGTLSSRRWPRALAGGRPFSQDYDGDGKTDMAVWRSGTWEVLRSSDGVFTTEVFGGVTGTPVPFMGGDYDGDHKDDLAESYTFENGRYLHIKYSLSGQAEFFHLGTPPSAGVVAGDFDGDGRADVTGWYQNMWRWIRSSDGQIESRSNPAGGTYGDWPAAGDYDGDGKTDVTFVKAYTSDNPGPNYYFLIQRSRDGFIGRPWGVIATDTPIVDGRSVWASFNRPANPTPGQIKEAARLPRLVSR